MEACNPRLLLDKSIGAEGPQRGVGFGHDVGTTMKYHHWTEMVETVCVPSLSSLTTRGSAITEFADDSWKDFGSREKGSRCESVEE